MYCYANAVLQCIANAPMIWSVIQSETAVGAFNKFILQMQRVARAGHTIIPSPYVTNCQLRVQMDDGMQDAAEYYVKLMDSFSKDAANSGWSGHMLFSVKYIQNISCDTCRCIVSDPSPICCSFIHIVYPETEDKTVTSRGEPETMQELFENSLYDRLCSQYIPDKKCLCTKPYEQNFTKTTHILGPAPRYLCLHINRSLPGFVYGKGHIKNRCVYKPVESLYVNILNKQDKTHRQKYCLYATVHHHGDELETFGGHYTCHVLYGDRWYEINDHARNPRDYADIDKTGDIVLLFYTCVHTSVCI